MGKFSAATCDNNCCRSHGVSYLKEASRVFSSRAARSCPPDILYLLGRLAMARLKIEFSCAVSSLANESGKFRAPCNWRGGMRGIVRNWISRLARAIMESRYLSPALFIRICKSALSGMISHKLGTKSSLLVQSWRLLHIACLIKDSQ